MYDKKTVVLSVLGTYLNGMVLDHFIFGQNIKRRVCIISRDKEKQIRDWILHTLKSGATIYQAEGVRFRMRSLRSSIRMNIRN